MRASQLLASTSLSLPPDTYIYDVVSVHGTDALATISSNDALRVIDESLQVTNAAFDRVHNGVTCLTNFESSVGCLVTVGRDGAAKTWDPRRAGSQSMQLDGGPNAPYLALASAGNKLAVGTELSSSQATIALWHVLPTVLHQSPKKPLLQYVESHNDDVTELCFHPSNSTLLLSGSTDGLVNVFDTAISDEDEALLQITNHGASIHHAGFLSPSEVYALSHDETFSIYQSDYSKDETDDLPPTVFGDLRALLDCDYVVNVLNYGNGYVLGAGSHSQQHLDLISLHSGPEWSLDRQQTVRLPGAHGEDIVRSMCFDKAKQVIFTGGEDGQLKAWQLPSEESVQDVQMSEDGQPSRKRKKYEVPESEKARFKPY